MPRIIYQEGLLDLEKFQEVCGERAKKTALIFPSNKSHHEADVTPVSVKSGGGLARVAKALGLARFLTVGLPTTDMQKWQRMPPMPTTQTFEQKTVQKAVSDLYRLLGAGCDLMLPVRKRLAFSLMITGDDPRAMARDLLKEKLGNNNGIIMWQDESTFTSTFFHYDKEKKTLLQLSPSETLYTQLYNMMAKTTTFENVTRTASNENLSIISEALGIPYSPSKYFSDALADERLEPSFCLEPSFYGENQRTPNLPLADYYTAEIDRLRRLTEYMATHGKTTLTDEELSSFFRNEALIDLSRLGYERAPNPLDDLRVFNAAYRIGRDQPTNSPWITPTFACQSLYDKTVKMLGEAASPEDKFLAGANALLRDYTKNNSSLHRFFSGHANRDHVKQVELIVSWINKNELIDVMSLNGAISDLKNMVKLNPGHELAKRIDFLERQFEGLPSAHPAPEPESPQPNASL